MQNVGSLVGSFARSFFCSLVGLFVRSLVRWFARSFVRWFASSSFVWALKRIFPVCKQQSTLLVITSHYYRGYVHSKKDPPCISCLGTIGV